MGYERLTKRNANGEVETVKRPKSSYIQEVYEEWDEINRELKLRLAELEDKIEAGTLIELPCKEGDIVYFVNWYRPTPRIEAFKVDHLEVNKNYIYVACYDFENEYNYSMYRMNSKDISFTKAEAEKRVEEIRKWK